MQILLESHGILGFIDGSWKCPTRFDEDSDVEGVETDAYQVSFEDDDIVILALNGLPSDYNIFRCMVRGREHVLSLKDFRSQLIAEEATLEQTNYASPFVSAMMAQNQTFQGKALVLDEGYPSSSKSAPSSHFPSGFNGGFSGNHAGFNGSNNGFNGHNTGGYSINHGSHFKGRVEVAIIIKFSLLLALDKIMGSVLLKRTVNTSLWHKRLGHPSNTITSALLRKLAKLPFPYPAVKSIKPLESDGGGEYLSNKFKHYLLTKDCLLSTSQDMPVLESATQSPLPVDPDFQPETLCVVLPLPAVNLHPMTTSLRMVEPSSFKAAYTTSAWQSAMREEIEALHAQGTWTDGSIARHKVRLVAKDLVKRKEEVYMTQPQGFESKLHPSDFVCRLKKSLYGLKQALSSLGTVILLLYVDDIILTGRLRVVELFYGLQISYQSTGLFVSQTKYIEELLDKVDLQDSKPCATPCLPYHRLLKDDGKPYSHPKQYSSIVGALQYLTFTRPDIALSVNHVVHNPMESHVVAVKRILRYLKAYSDADWAGDPNDRRSVSGFIVYLGSSPISWASKKQHTVSRSSTKAEYRALATTAAELAWIRQLFYDLHEELLVIDQRILERLENVNKALTEADIKSARNLCVDLTSKPTYSYT
ncbi:hypothetical protein Prudu_192S000300, partial [Prunus dulcis]